VDKPLYRLLALVVKKLHTSRVGMVKNCQRCRCTVELRLKSNTSVEPGIISRRTGCHSGLGLHAIIWIASLTLHTRRMTHFFEGGSVPIDSGVIAVEARVRAEGGGLSASTAGCLACAGSWGRVIVWWWLSVLPEGTAEGGVQAWRGVPFTTRERRPRKILGIKLGKHARRPSSMLLPFGPALYRLQTGCSGLG
jgi:hypothetical protein